MERRGGVPRSRHEKRERAYEIALGLLARRERSAAELRERLGRRGFDEPTVEGVLERLQAAGLQDDTRVAFTLAEEGTRGRGLAARGVFEALRRRGIETELAASAAAEPPEQEEARAVRLADERARALEHLPPPVIYRRLVSYLARRGYPAEVCRSAAEAACGGAGVAAEAAWDRAGAPPGGAARPRPPRHDTE